MLTALTNYIGILGGGTAPDSGLYINSLPGISLENIEKLAKPEQLTYLGVWSDVQERALRKLSLDTALHFAKRYRIKNISRSVDFGRKIDTVDSQSSAIDEYRGFAIELTFKNNAGFVYSNFQSLYVENLRVYLKAIPSGNVTVKVFDMDSGETLDTFTVLHASAVVGWNEIKAQKNYSAYRIFIGFDATEIDSAYQWIYPNISTYFESAAWDLFGSFFQNGFIRGAQTTGKNPDVLSYGVNSYGMSGVFSLLCSYDTFICNNRQSFATPLLYLLGAEMMVERLYSPRLNRFTTTDLKEAGELKDYFQAEYERNLEQLISGIDLNTSDVCLECNAPITIVSTTI